jgi:hypothetical protein
MAVIGEVIKKVIDLNGFINSEPNPVEAQTKVLQHLLEKAKSTAFGKKYNFSKILSHANIIKAFQDEVPVFDYDTIFNEWWHLLLQGHQNVTWPGGQRYFALSSGTTSKSKYIPVTDDMLNSIKHAGIQQVMSLRNFDLPGEFFEKQIMMLGSSTKLVKKENHLEGEISGISASTFPLWFKKYYKPGFEIASIEDWNERIKRIAEEAPGWDIGSISGIPSWVELLLKEIISHNNLRTIHDIWPNLLVYTSGGIAFEPYRKSLEKLFSKPLIYIDTYLASEGYIATQKRQNISSMALLLSNGIFFEFVPFDENTIDEMGKIRKSAKVLTLEQAEENIEYVLLISTVSGAWRYMIGDTVIITDKKRSEIKISGRTKQYLTVVGEQLSIYKLNLAIEKLEHQFDMEIKEFVVATVLQDEKYILKWIIGSNKNIDKIEAADFIDKELSENNKNYNLARERALKGLEIEVIPVDYFYRWSEEYKKLGGQIKIPRVMNEKDFREFEQFVKSLS